MKGEIPVCRRCCFCVPLRYGLLTWGYFKLIADALLVALLSKSLIFDLTMIKVRECENGDFMNYMYREIIIIIIAIIVFFTDLIVTIVFVVGGHKKNLKLIKVFYFLSMGMLVVSFLLAATAIVLSVHNLISRSMRYWIVFDAVLISSFYFLVLVVQSYFLLLLRSEIIKLRNIGDFRFVNNAAEAECTMNCEEITEVDEAATEMEGA